MEILIEQRRGSDIFEVEMLPAGKAFLAEGQGAYLFEASLAELQKVAADIAAAIERRTV